MTKYLAACVLCVLAGYGFVEAWPLLAGPSLTIDSPVDNAAYPSGIVQVQGETAHVTALTVNGTPTLHDEEGRFSTTLTFPQGGSILTFVATDRFGRTVTATRSIFVPTTNAQ